MNQKLDPNCAGECSVSECYEMLAKESAAVLVDVRTKAEWTYVGVPDLSELGKSPIFVEWQVYPAMDVNAQFVDELRTEFGRREVKQETPIFFLCRSGVRSMSAASLMTSIGYVRCLNVLGGFEGPIDENKHRGGKSGWKAADLPWLQF